MVRILRLPHSTITSGQSKSFHRYNLEDYLRSKNPWKYITCYSRQKIYSKSHSNPTPPTAKDRRICWLLSRTKKSSITHHVEENGMASPTQTVVDKGKSNSLIAESLLKILRELIPPNPIKILYQFSPIEW